MKTKQMHGQFYTTRAKYIIGNLIDFLPKTAQIIDPFAGQGDLLNLFPNHSTIGFDLQPQSPTIQPRDTLINPPNYTNYWVVTNPPYLAKNKNKLAYNSALYNHYQTNDLYKIALKTIMNCQGGILILPLNFWCEEASDIRKEFLSQFKVYRLNVFEEQVFNDTSYTICSFYFQRANLPISDQLFDVVFFPTGKTEEFQTYQEEGFRLGWDFYKGISYAPKPYNISRITEQNLRDKMDYEAGTLTLRAIDGGGVDNRIQLFYSEEPYVDRTPNASERTFAGLQLPHITEKELKTLARLFNQFIEEAREKYHSLFLINYRNSTAKYARKRIGFETAYQIIRHLLNVHKDEFYSLPHLIPISGFKDSKHSNRR